MKEGYILTIQGCPVGFASAGTDMSSLPTGNADWPTGLTAGNVVYAGLDASFLGSWTEEIDPIHATFQGGGMSFRLHDKLFSYAGADRNIASYLFTRNDQEENQLAATLLSTATTGDTFTVQAPHSLSGTNFVVWIEGEAILCSSISTNTVTIQTRGYYGTKVATHKVDSTMNYFPTVWSDFPGTVKQDLKLWRQDSSGNSTVIWRGTCQRAPRLAGNGAQVELQCEHIWNRISQKKYEVPSLTTKFHGIDGNAVRMRFSADGVPGRYYSRLDPTLVPPDNRWIKNCDMVTHAHYLCLHVLQPIPNLLIGSSRPDGDTLHVGSNFLSASMHLRGFHGPEFMSQLSVPVDPATERREGLYRVDLDITNRLVYQTFTNGAGVQLLVTEPWVQFEDTPDFTASGSLTTCLTRPAFFAEIKDDQDVFVNRNDAMFFFYPTSYEFGVGSQDAGLAYITGSAYFYPKDLSEDFDGPNQDYHGVAQQEQLKFRYSLTSRHWLDLFRYGVIERYENTSNWNFSNHATNKFSLPTAPYKTELLMDGTQTYADLFSTFGTMYGCVVSTTGSAALTFRKIDLPGSSTQTVATITPANLVDKPTWELNPEGLVTSVVYKSNGFSGEDKQLIINDKGAYSRYGQGETVEIDLTKFGSSERWIFRTREQLGIIASKRFFQMFGKPYDKVTFTLDLRYIDVIFPGHCVTLSDWLIPNGSGGRGLSSKKVYVVARNVDLKEGTIQYTALSFASNTLKGWSPCVKLSDINIGTKTLTVTGSYLATSIGEVTDYAGSTLDPYAGTANDRGISFFTAGDRAELILRDSTNYSTFPVTIATVGSSTITINETITTGSVDWPAQAASGNVDLRFDNYSTSGMQAAQLTYAFVGNTTTGQIQATVKNQRFR